MTFLNKIHLSVSAWSVSRHLSTSTTRVINKAHHFYAGSFGHGSMKCERNVDMKSTQSSSLSLITARSASHITSPREINAFLYFKVFGTDIGGTASPSSYALGYVLASYVFGLVAGISLFTSLIYFTVTFDVSVGGSNWSPSHLYSIGSQEKIPATLRGGRVGVLERFPLGCDGPAFYAGGSISLVIQLSKVSPHAVITFKETS